MHPGRAAGQEHNDGAKEETDHSDQDQPDGDGELGVVTAIVLVHMSFDDPERDEVTYHGHE